MILRQAPRNVDTAVAESPLWQGDSFRLSVLLLIGLTIVQRGIGLVRNVLFCGMLEDHELGQWSLASNFLGWAAPFVVLGLPGSFGRLSEHYRQKGMLRQFLRRTTTICMLLVLVALAVHAWAPSLIAIVVFNDPALAPVAITLGWVLAAVIGMNFLTEFLTSVRLNRAVSCMHLANSLLFTGFAVLLLLMGADHQQSLLIAFGGSAFIAALIGMVYSVRVWRSLPDEPARVDSAGFWQRIAPLAVWIWCGNAIGNLFDMSDLFVLKHHPGVPDAMVDSMIGQLYASRIVPVMIVTVAAMIGNSLLPYLIQDWERGESQEVCRRLNAVMKFAAIGFTLVAALTHIFSPLLFTWVLRGKYDSGLHLMPLGFVQYTWFSLCMIANKYLICTDRARLVLVPMGLGLVISVGLTSWFAPEFGLWGVVWATATANGLATALLLVIAHRCGMRWDRGVWISMLLPLTMALGGWASLLITVAVLFGSLGGNGLLNHEEREQLLEVVGGRIRRVCLLLGIRPVAS